VEGGVGVGHAGDLLDQLVGDVRQTLEVGGGGLTVAETPPSERQFERLRDHLCRLRQWPRSAC
jgi:hypothetical protein